MTSDWIEIEVINWQRYNPRTDRKKHSWFRLENNIIAEPKFYGLSAAQKFVAICLFAEVAKGETSCARIHIPWLADQVKISTDEIQDAVTKLVANGVLRLPVVTSGDRSVSGGSPTYVRTNERTNDTDEQPELVSDEPEQVSFDFDALYSKYPRKVNPSEGKKRAAQAIKSLEDYNQLSTAIDRYAQYCKRNKTEERFILHFATFIEKRDSKPFVQPWRDWLDPQAGEANNNTGVHQRGEDLDAAMGDLFQGGM